MLARPGFLPSPSRSVAGRNAPTLGRLSETLTHVGVLAPELAAVPRLVDRNSLNNPVDREQADSPARQISTVAILITLDASGPQVGNDIPRRPSQQAAATQYGVSGRHDLDEVNKTVVVVRHLDPGSHEVISRRSLGRSPENSKIPEASANGKTILPEPELLESGRAVYHPRRWHGHEANGSGGTAEHSPTPLFASQQPELSTTGVQGVRSASIGAVLTSDDTARAKSSSDVMKASAWSCVSATYSASYVVSQPSWPATFHAVR